MQFITEHRIPANSQTDPHSTWTYSCRVYSGARIRLTGVPQD